MIVAILIGTSFAYSQTYNMANGNISACSGTFYDNGGAGSNYSANQNITYTICPSTPGQMISVNFSMFDLESGWDYLYIYDGNSIGAPQIGQFTGSTNLGTITATNPGGCLTFRFTSDGSVNNAGWAATINCVSPTVPGVCAGAISMPITGTCTTCTSTLYDSGGAGANYSNSENRTYTICPATPGARLQVLFTAFNTENSYDYLTIYDGNNTGANIIGTYSGNTSPGTVIASLLNATGCLTFRFTSDGSVNYAGFAATLSCILPCQTITPIIISTNPGQDPDGVIRVCPNENINFVGSSTFSNSGTGAVYKWVMGDGTTNNGANINDSYPNGGAYVAYLNVTDPMGCIANSPERIIEVATNPVITTGATPSTLCTNQTAGLTANVTMTPFEVNCTPPVSGTTFLPDGSGVSYSTSITTDCYPPSSTITSVADFLNVCLDLEHSYLGDLGISFTCPSGQTVVLKAYPGGSNTFLGAPIDDDLNLAPGTPRTYCFTPSSTILLVNGPTSLAGVPAGQSVNSGNYMPVTNFSNFIGCPLNGTWTITVTDNMGSDNGYIFEWGFDLAASLSSVTGFTPTIVSQGWVANPNIVSTGLTTANATPTATGTPCYTYQVIDNFGCVYTSTQCLTVGCTSLGAELVEFDAKATNDGRVLINWTTSMERDNTEFIVEHLTTENVWNRIANVPSQGKASVDQYYQAYDYFPYYGNNYYRLISEDMNGEITFSDVRLVKISSSLRLYPNPTKNIITIVGLTSKTDELVITDSFGRIIQTNKVVDSENITIDLHKVKPGVYQIQIEDKVLKFVKE